MKRCCAKAVHYIKFVDKIILREKRLIFSTLSKKDTSVLRNYVTFDFFKQMPRNSKMTGS